MKNLKLLKSLIAVSVIALIVNISSAQDSAKVELIDAPSAAMNKSIPAIVVLPDAYFEKKEARFPVLYLLHGHSGNHESWMKIQPALQQLASRNNFIIVCPNGSNSWYWDSPVDASMRYQTYVAEELVKLIDSKYRTIANRKGRAITGLSMGGHGGLWLGINRSDVFGACGSMSGGVDIRPFPHNWHMSNSLGSYAENPEIWEKHTVINIIHKIKTRPIDIIIDCGTSDFFYRVNEELHKKLLYNNIPHDYITRPGAHNAPYWKNAIDYQALFFSKFFNK